MKILSSTSHVTHIIHLADLHIRTGDKVQSRATEYALVFARLFEDIHQLPCVLEGTALIVIAGDVFHNKGRIETEGASVLFDWLNRILQLAPVLVIAGNHDFRQEDPSYIDAVDMMVKPYEHSSTKYPIHYLKDTDHYVWGNLGIGMCSVKDTLRAFNTAGCVAELPPFPEPEAFASGEHTVAMFHGTITQSALPNGRSVDSVATGYPLDWFAGYDIVLLGDNHKQQVNASIDPQGNPQKWGYPGSLVQQDDGEPTFGHGYILWDLKTKEGKTHHVRNDYGSITLLRNSDRDRSSESNDLLVRLSAREIVPLHEASAHPSFPKYPKVRLVALRQTETGYIQEVEKALKALCITPSHIKTVSSIGKQDGSQSQGDIASSSSSSASSSIHDGLVRMSEVNTPRQWEAYTTQLAPTLGVSDWIYDPKRILMSIDRHQLPKGIVDKIKTRNTALQKLIDAYDEAVQSIHSHHHHAHAQTSSSSIVLKAMDWAYVMCYGEGNYMDFDSLEGGIALLNGANAAGKSSFLDVICIGLYGDTTTSRQETNDVKMISNIVHDDKPVLSQAYVRVEFMVGDKRYQIKRSFGDRASGVRRAGMSAVHEIDNCNQELVLVAEGTQMVDTWVHTRFGNLQDMLMSTAICQMDNTSFFNIGGAAQKELLDRCLNLNTLSAYQSILEEAVRAYKVITSDLATHIAGRKERNKTKVPTQVQLPSTQDTATLTSTLTELQNQLNNIENKLGELNAARSEILAHTGVVSEDAKRAAKEYSRTEVDDKLHISSCHYDRVSAQCPLDTSTTQKEKEKLLQQQGHLAQQQETLRTTAREANILNSELNDTIVYNTVRIVAIESSLEACHARKPKESKMTHVYIAERKAAYSEWCARHPSRRSRSYTEQSRERLQNLTNQLDTMNSNPVTKPDDEATALQPQTVLSSLSTLSEALSLDMLHNQLETAKASLQVHSKLEPPVANARPLALLQSMANKYTEWSSNQDAHLLHQWSLDPSVVCAMRDAIQLRLHNLSTECDSIQESLVSVAPSGQRPEADNTSSDSNRSKSITALESENDRLLKRIATMRAQLTSISPTISKSGRDAWKVERTKWKALCSKVKMYPSAAEMRAYRDVSATTTQKIRTVEAALSDLQDEITSLEAIPFNHTCWACTAHHKPTQERLVTKRDSLALMQHTLNGLLSESRELTSNRAARVKDIDDAIAKRELYESNVDRMTREHTEWLAAGKDWGSVTRKQKTLETLEHRQLQLAWAIYDIHVANATSLRQYRDMTRANYDMYVEFCREASVMVPENCDVVYELEVWKTWSVWKAQQDRLQTSVNNAKHNLYTAWKQQRDLLVTDHANLQNELHALEAYEHEYENWKEELRDINAEEDTAMTWDLWSNEYDALRKRVQHVKIVVRWREEWEANTAALLANQSRLKSWQDAEEAAVDVAKWKQIQNLQTLAVLDAEITEKHLTTKSLQHEISVLTHQLSDAMENNSIDQEYIDELTTLHADLDRLTKFRDIFVGTKGCDGMKEAIYRDRVIPLIMNEVNAFLEDLEDFRFTIEVHNTKLVYKVRDRGNTVLLGHCSGYQKFMIGLGMRTALCRIGAAGQSVKHLIIDEGFGCCDAQNMQRAKQIVCELMARGEYKSIILMSHLDAIREISQCTINITRNNGKFSYIRHGPAAAQSMRKYAIYKKTIASSDTNPNPRDAPPTLTKARGRPRKA